jgi:hypothetical protein
MTDVSRYLHLIIDGKVGTIVGMANLTRPLDGLIAQQGKLTAATKAFGDAGVREAARYSAAMTKEVERTARLVQTTDDRLLRLNTRKNQILLSQENAANAGRITAYRKMGLQLEEINRQIAASVLSVSDAQKTATAAQSADADALIAKNKAVAASQQASLALAKSQRTAAVGAALATTGRVALGSGAAILGGSIYAAVKAGSYQSFLSQQQASSPLKSKQIAALSAMGWNLATTAGVNPRDVVTAGRYGSDLGLGFQLDKRTVRAAAMAAVPAGSTIASFLPAIGSAQVNFGGYRQQPMKLANMLLQTARLGRINNPGDLATAIPQTLVQASHYHNNAMLPQSLAVVAALTRSGLPVEEANTAAYNLISRIPVPTPAVKKFLDWLKTSKGVDLTGDFTVGAMQSKGILGILNDIKSANLAPDALRKLFPYMRSYTGALALAGNQNKSLNDIYGGLVNSNKANPVGANWQRYENLPSTKYAAAMQSWDKAVVDFGTSAMPVLTELLKDITPMVRGLDSLTKSNKNMIPWVVKGGIALTGLGVGLKAAAAGFKVAQAGAGVFKVIRSGLLGLIGSGTGDAAALAAAGGDASAGSIASLSAFGPLGIAIAGTIGLSLAANQLYDHWKPFHSFVDGVTLNFQKIAKAAAEASVQVINFGTLGHVKIGSSQWLGIADTIAKSAMSIVPGGPSAVAMVDAVLNHKSGTPKATYSNKAAMINAAASPVYSGKKWTLGSYFGSTAGLPKGFTGRWFGSSYGPTSNNYLSDYQSWWANVLGEPKAAGKIGDTDFPTINGTAGNPYELPGNTRAKWTFVKYIPDPKNKGQDIAVWRDPMGKLQAFNHTDPRGVKTPTGWRVLRPGQYGYGGNTAGYSMESHVCIVTTPDGRQDIMVLTGQGEMQQRKAGNKVQRLPNAGASTGSKTGGINASIKTAAAQYKENPAMLYGVYRAEGGSKASPLFGDPSGTAKGAAASLAADFHWTYTTKGQTLVKAYGFPNTTQGHWEIPLVNLCHVACAIREA